MVAREMYSITSYPAMGEGLLLKYKASSKIAFYPLQLALKLFKKVRYKRVAPEETFPFRFQRGPIPR